VPLRANNRTASLGIETLVLLLVAFALPRGTLPSGLALACAALSWLSFAIALLPLVGRTQPVWQLAAGTGLVALAVNDPPLWLAVGGGLSCIALSALNAAATRKCWISLGVGVLAPAVLYAALFAVGGDERVALRLAFRAHSSPAQLAACVLSLLLVVGLTLLLLIRSQAAPERLLRPLCLALGSLVLFVLVARLVCIAMLLTLPSDLLIWSEAPALTNLLKLHGGEPFYGPSRGSTATRTRLRSSSRSTLCCDRSSSSCRCALIARLGSSGSCRPPWSWATHCGLGSAHA
jgi:hypothetical protein